MLKTKPCAIVVEFQCLVSNKAYVLLSQSIILQNPVILSLEEFLKLLKHPGMQQCIGFGILALSFLICFICIYLPLSV